MQAVLNGNDAVSAAFDKAVEKYSQVLNRLGQEFEDRFCDFDQLEPCVSFVTNPFMQVDMTCTDMTVQLGCWTGRDRNPNVAK